jgi:hypothetical protein
MKDPKQLHLEALFYPVGELIINWSLFDYQLVVMVAVLYSTEIGKSLEKQLPREFGRRIRFLRKCISRVPELQPYATNFKNMLTSAKAMVVVRDTLVHGVLQGYNSKDQLYSFQRPEIDKSDDIHVIDTVKMTLETIKGHASVSQDLLSFALQISEYLLKTFP